MGTTTIPLSTPRDAKNPTYDKNENGRVDQVEGALRSDGYAPKYLGEI